MIAGTAIICLAAGLSACSKSGSDGETAGTSTTTSTTTTPADNSTAATTTTETASTNGATPAAAGPPAADNTDTLAGVKFASYTGDAASGKTVFIQCQTCHSSEAGKNMIGPSLHGVVGRHSGIEPGFTYSSANKNSGITWSEEKLFQYLENPQRVIPGTKMTYTGVKDPQKRADVIAYLKSNS